MAGAEFRFGTRGVAGKINGLDEMKSGSSG